MPNLTRDELIATVTREKDAGWTYDDDLYARVVHAIRTVPITDLATIRPFDDFDEIDATDAELVALTIDFHYGIGWALSD